MREAVTVLFILICLALIIVVIMQEGKSAGLTGTISGAAETYWGKNKGRSIESKLVKITTGLTVAFFVVAAVLTLH